MLGSVLGMAAPGMAWAITPDGAISDCARPASRAERVICTDPDLMAADRGLAGLAAQLRQRMPDSAAAAAAQIDWVRRRDRMCAPGMTPDCLQIAYAEREAWIRARLLMLPPPPPPMAAAPEPPPAPRPQQPGPVPPPAVPALATAPGVPFALSLAGAPCGAVSSNALRVMGWSVGDSPFGLPLEQWSKPDFTALARRSAECQAENGDSPRNVQAMGTVLERLRAVARDRPAAPAASQPAVAAPPPRATLPQSLPPAAPAPARPAEGGEGPQAALNCADPALLQDVSFTFQATPGLSAGARVQRLSNPRPYNDVIMEAYSATPALRAEYQRLRPYMVPVPQCLVNAETSLGEVVLSYRLYVEGGRPLVEVQRVP
ncbi:lysozyme inhibitor LprI family protein [Teichococcus wenyumeiae]|uniref:hypothetical protein n=1 Tax=Teichococcus wenyumeiae TaxID=2478470 RepID=UPI0011C40916|nr:hypothetical protein [Pseudoroseomonas wenyumeiae]